VKFRVGDRVRVVNDEPHKTLNTFPWAIGSIVMVTAARGGLIQAADSKEWWTATRFESVVRNPYAGTQWEDYLPQTLGPKPTYQLVESESIRPFDVDGTLILPNNEENKHLRLVSVRDDVEEKEIEFRVHEPMVRLLLEEHARGSFVIVWSRSGFAWAEAVVIALGLVGKVHLIMSKPIAYFDDVPVEAWMKDRVFIEPSVQYKK
jgi:hypothetical protein